ncbi:protein FAM177B [Ctenodactylus gundi]
MDKDNSQRLELEKSRPSEEMTPRRIIHFADGDLMEEYSSEEEEEQTGHGAAGAAHGSFTQHCFFPSACEYLGGKFAVFFGLTQPKYQYVLNEYYRLHHKDNEERGLKAPEATVLSEKHPLETRSREYGT